MKESIVLLAAVVAVLGIVPAANAQQVVIGQRVPADQRISMDRIDHSSWNALLQKYVNDAGQVNYAAWHQSTGDQRALDSYISHLSAASNTVAATREGQMAYWINVYNAVTIKGILREYPTKTIRNHTSKIGGYNIWKHLQLAVVDTQVSLDAMEHEILRKMDEPRIHFAIVCASHSCPRLLNQAYTGPQLNDQLTLNTRNFFANRENFQYDARRGQFKLSSIIKWFADDFGADQAARLATIAPYLPTREAYNAATNNSVRVSYLDYDWSLNEQKQTQARQGSSRRQGSGRR